MISQSIHETNPGKSRYAYCVNGIQDCYQICTHWELKYGTVSKYGLGHRYNREHFNLSKQSRGLHKKPNSMVYSRYHCF